MIVRVIVVVVMMTVSVVVGMTADFHIAATKSASTFFAHINPTRAGVLLKSRACYCQKTPTRWEYH